MLSYANKSVVFLKYINKFVDSRSGYAIHRTNEIRLPFPKQIFRNFYSSSLYENELDEESRRRLKLYKLQLRVWHEQGDEVCDPESLTWNDWQYALTIKSEAERKAYFSYLLSIIISKSLEKGTETRQHSACAIAADQIQNNLFDFLTEETMQKCRNSRQWLARIFNDPKLIFDCSYDHHMALKNRLNAASELSKSLQINQKHLLPFNIHLTGVTFNQLDTADHLQQKIPDLGRNTNPVRLHTECFSTLFPTNQLIYLTPFSRNVIQTYSPNDIFVIGAIEGNSSMLQSAALAKAKRLNIQTAWFPLEHYLNWDISAQNRTLPLSHVTNIMLGIKFTKNWNKAFVGLPKYEIMEQRPSRTSTVQFGRDVRFKINKRIIGSGVPRYNLEKRDPGDGYFKQKP